MQNLNPVRRYRHELITNSLVISTEVMSGEIMVFAAPVHVTIITYYLTF